MTNTLQKVKVFFNRVLGFFPSRIPTGVTEFDAWSDSIFDTYAKGIGLTDRDSTRWALSNQIMHMESTEAYKAKRFFALMLHKAASNQVSYFVMQTIKEKQAAQQAAAKQAAEVTVPTQVSDEQPKP
jgi:hypothetical protein